MSAWAFRICGAVAMAAILPLVRHGLTFLGGIVVSKGLLDQQTAEAAAGAIVTLISVGWMIYSRRSVQQ